MKNGRTSKRRLSRSWASFAAALSLGCGSTNEAQTEAATSGSESGTSTGGADAASEVDGTTDVDPGDPTSVDESDATGTTGMATDASETTAGGSTGSPDDTGSSETGDDVYESLPTPGCARGDSRAPGEYEDLELEVFDVTRKYDLFLPDAYDGNAPIPVVFNFHGFLQNPGRQAEISGMNEAASDRGFAVVYPEGLFSSWNAGICCGTASGNGFRDVAFIRDLVEALGNETCLDARRFYVTGFSNGGYMAHRLACEAADLFAAVASVSGTLGVEPCEPTRPIPLLEIHGTADTIVPYDGDGPVDNPSTPEAMASWVERNACEPRPEVVSEQDDASCERWSGCADDVAVELCTIVEGQHCWPGSSGCNSTYDATMKVVDFLESFVLPARPNL